MTPEANTLTVPAMEFTPFDLEKEPEKDRDIMNKDS